MYALRIVTTMFVAAMMVILGAISIKGKDDTATLAVVGAMELIYVLCLVCMWR